jgi:hypothetical protein
MDMPFRAGYERSVLVTKRFLLGSDRAGQKRAAYRRD